MVTSISAFRRHLLHYHTESLSLRGGIVAYSTISPADAHRRVVLDSVRQGGRAAFRQRLRQEMTFITPPTVPFTRSDLRPADYTLSTESGSSLSSGGLTNDTEYDEEFGLDWSSVDLPDLTRARVGSVRPTASADLDVPMELQRFTENWDVEPDVHVEQYISPNIPVAVVPSDGPMVVNVLSPPRQPTPPPEPFWEAPRISAHELAASIVQWMDFRPDDDADAISQAVLTPLGNITNGQRRASHAAINLSVELLRLYCDNVVRNLVTAFGHIAHIDPEPILRYLLDQLAMPLRRPGMHGERASLEPLVDETEETAD